MTPITGTHHGARPLPKLHLPMCRVNIGNQPKANEAQFNQQILHPSRHKRFKITRHSREKSRDSERVGQKLVAEREEKLALQLQDLDTQISDYGNHEAELQHQQIEQNSEDTELEAQKLQHDYIGMFSLSKLPEGVSLEKIGRSNASRTYDTQLPVDKNTYETPLLTPKACIGYE